MRNYILFDDDTHHRLRPLTFTRPVSEIRLGILTIRQKWELYLKTTVSYKTEVHLQEKYPIVLSSENVFINASFLPDEAITEQINKLKPNEAIKAGGKLIAVCLAETSSDFNHTLYLNSAAEIQLTSLSINYPEHIFLFNKQALIDDFTLITKGRISAAVPEGTRVLGDSLFIEEGANVNLATINTQTGPVYIGKNAEIMEGALIRGPFAACDGAVVKMGAKIYGATTLGPNSVVGGEVKNCVIIGNSNKGHEGYLGDSVIGEWCNLGADTNNSNLKNNFGSVKVWNYADADFRDTQLQKYGVIMGDHSKTSINTMLNTGSVIGVGCSIATTGFPPKFVPDFTWHQNEVYSVFQLEKFWKTALEMMKTKKTEFNDEEKRILEYVYSISRKGY
ncbi:putative sugar nucleotidyl transferase [Solitalea canadensis]|uniref:UDP-N-acetylglucosamine diphosphorylase/glucosamine-1-phosphate N-acetyltransferase n=1 Tax=Solitalea canadensis (strain ATCC 29591 / DSM 3403 / JCM 21819 / LMG 8368 / NBRC 15130 / NCIMB 12057 / USAM 9D) TaxID=929556 RepID=H8KPK7_SOLCM|nr:putative sugar nucleotidyl transferase [Solitalea canadensis]AFD05905.1 UDP-N-acetylglucosamine diphosphorylase/glucosamine-1-phosphate N-acetyltransferase [Solitalea canadensis DSM 3403]